MDKKQMKKRPDGRGETPGEQRLLACAQKTAPIGSTVYCHRYEAQGRQRVVISGTVVGYHVVQTKEGSVRFRGYVLNAPVYADIVAPDIWLTLEAALAAPWE